MGWADPHIRVLKQGQEVQFRPSGNSMVGRINSKQLVTVSPDISDVKVDDIVLCRVMGRDYLHIVEARKEDQYLIRNNRGLTNGWTRQVYGKCIRIED